MAQHLLADLIRQSGSVVIDGAMSTALEKAGCDLNDKLWSARVLIEEPDKIRQVHADYFEAGANVAITASYQATEAGFKERGIDSQKAYGLIAQSVTLAHYFTICSFTAAATTSATFGLNASGIMLSSLNSSSGTRAENSFDRGCRRPLWCLSCQRCRIYGRLSPFGRSIPYLSPIAHEGSDRSRSGFFRR